MSRNGLGLDLLALWVPVFVLGFAHAVTFVLVRKKAHKKNRE